MLLRIINIIRYYLIYNKKVSNVFCWEEGLGNEPSLKLQLHLVNKCGSFIRHVKDPPPVVQMRAIDEMCWAIQYMDNPCEKAQLESIRQDLTNYYLIKHPTEKVKKLFLDKKNATKNNLNN